MSYKELMRQMDVAKWKRLNTQVQTAQSMYTDPDIWGDSLKIYKELSQNTRWANSNVTSRETIYGLLTPSNSEEERLKKIDASNKQKLLIANRWENARKDENFVLFEKFQKSYFELCEQLSKLEKRFGIKTEGLKTKFTEEKLSKPSILRQMRQRFSNLVKQKGFRTDEQIAKKQKLHILDQIKGTYRNYLLNSNRLEDDALWDDYANDDVLWEDFAKYYNSKSVDTIVDDKFVKDYCEILRTKFTKIEPSNHNLEEINDRKASKVAQATAANQFDIANMPSQAPRSQWVQKQIDMVAETWVQKNIAITERADSKEFDVVTAKQWAAEAEEQSLTSMITASHSLDNNDPLVFNPADNEPDSSNTEQSADLPTNEPFEQKPIIEQPIL